MGPRIPSDEHRISVTECKFAGTGICAIDESLRMRKGDKLCGYCSQTHPKILMARLDIAKDHLEEGFYEEYKKLIEDLWTEQDTRPKPCAWRQKRFWNDKVPNCHFFVTNIWFARSDANEELEKTGAEVDLTFFRCGQVEKDTEICRYCVKAMKSHGTPKLRELISDDKYLDPMVVQELEAYLNSAGA